MQQQAALMAATGQGHYLTPVTLAHVPQAVTALAAPNGISTATMTPTTATLANGKLLLDSYVVMIHASVWTMLP